MLIVTNAECLGVGSTSLVSNPRAKDRIHKTSFSSLLMNKPNKLECWSLVSLSCLMLCKSLAYWVNSQVIKNMQCCEYGPCTIKHYRLVIYWNWTDFVVRQCLFYFHSLTLVRTNTLAYTGIRAFRIQYVFYSTGPWTKSYNFKKFCEIGS